MADQRGGSERKNYIIKTLLIVVLLLLALLSTVFYVYAYPKTTITLYSICGNQQEKETSFQIKKYSTLGAINPIEKFGYSFKYWSYDINGYQKYNKDKEIDVDYLDLYGMYEVKEFNVRLWIQEYDGDIKQDQPKLYKTYTNIKFNSELKLDDGRVDGELISRLSARMGYDFVGWTTKVEEEDIISEADITRVGLDSNGDKYPGIFYVMQDSDVDLYAYWEKREFNVITHTGNELLMDTPNTPHRENGKFVYSNTRVEEILPIKYLNTLYSVTSDASATLDERDGMVGSDGVNIEDYKEYEFKGWYLDPDFLVPSDPSKMTVAIVKKSIDGVIREVPYLRHSEDPSRDYESTYNEDTQSFEFHLYSKWERKSYTLSFNKNFSGVSTGSTKIPSIQVYKYDDHYGKYYQTAIFNRGNAESEYFHTLDLSSDEITTSEFLSAFANYRFIGWSPVSRPNKDTFVYYKWQQLDISTGNSQSMYINKEYKHTVSEDVTLYAQWSLIRSVTFYEKSGTSSGRSFVIKGIADEWFHLPGTEEIVDTLGWLDKSYTYFAGWKKSSYSDPIYEFVKGVDYDKNGLDDIDGSPIDALGYKLDAGGARIKNPDFIHIITSSASSNFNYYAYWEKKIYTVEFHYNDGTGRVETKSVIGGSDISFPATPTRENFIFDGWSTIEYDDNSLNKSIVKSARANSDDEVLKFYGSWTTNFTIEFDANQGEFTRAPRVITYKDGKGKDLKLNAGIISSSTLRRTGYRFDGWALKINGEIDSSFKFSQGSTYTFNFAENKCLRTGEVEPHPFQLEDGYKVKIYALWKANSYTISVYDTLNNNKKESITTNYDATEGLYIDLLNLEDDKVLIPSHQGYKFKHLSTDRNGNNVALEVDEYGRLLLPRNQILSNLTFYAIYEKKTINLSYKFVNSDGNIIDYVPTLSSISHGDVPYGATLNLPELTFKDFGNANYKFLYWYYLEGEGEEQQEVQAYSQTPLKYDGEQLVLWGKFEELVYKLAFNLINPLNTKDVTRISTWTVDGETQEIVVKKGDNISTELYNYILGQVNDWILAKDIKEYAYKGMYYNYLEKTYEFKGNSALPSLTLFGDTLTYETSFEANSVKFVYKYKEEEIEQHTGNKYNSAQGITLTEPAFSLGSGEEINSWYIVKRDDAESKKVFEKGVDLIRPITGEFKCVADLKDYIVWTLDEETDRYVGKITIYAETKRMINIEYYAFGNDGELNDVGTKQEEYSTFGNSISIPSKDVALKGYSEQDGLVFNGWRVYSTNGMVTSIGDNGLVKNGFDINDISLFPNMKVQLYADISYKVVVKTMTLSDGVFQETVLSDNTYSLLKNNGNFSKSEDYYKTYKLENITLEGIPTGYEHYGYRVGTDVYSKAQVNDGKSVEINGEKIEILCYLARTITATYTVGTGETFDDDTTTAKTFTYVLGYDGSVIARREGSLDTPISQITIENVGGKKYGHIFAGWSIKVGEVVYSDVYEAGQTLHIDQNTTFIAIFQEPEEGTLSAVIKYYYEQDGELELLTSETITDTNGKTISLKTIASADLPSALKDRYGITGWTYNGTLVENNQFSIPLLIVNNQTFEFVAVLKLRYTVKFETYSADKVNNLVVYDGDAQTLIKTPTLDNGKTFKYWSYSASNLTEPIKINAIDTIVFSISETSYRKEETVNNTIHYIPAIEDIYTYTFYAVGENIKLTLIADEQQKIISDIPFGASYTVRELVEKGEFSSLETSQKGIAGWTTDGTKCEMSYYNTDELRAQLTSNITNITGDTTLYAVWQSKYTLTYAEETSTFGYKNNPDRVESYFAGETVSFSKNVIKCIYFKGYNTVYMEDGEYIVYREDGSSVFYTLTGFEVSYQAGSSTATTTYNIGDTFEMPEANITVTPITHKTVYEVQFNDNYSTEPILYTTYVDSLSDVTLSNYTASRRNFELLGWNTDKDATSVLSSLSGDNANVVLFAIWKNTLEITFSVGARDLFKVSLTRDSKINKTELENFLQMNNKSENGYFNNVKLNNNSRTYSFDNQNYYLSKFICQNQVFDTTTELCEVVFESNARVSLNLLYVYTIKYTQLDDGGSATAIEGVADDYFVNTGTSAGYGRITETSNSGALTFPEYTSANNEYYSASSWIDSANNTYSFNATATQVNFETLVSYRDSQDSTVITLSLYMTANSIGIKLNFIADPYSEYSQYSQYDTSDSLKTSEAWTDVALANVVDSRGNTFGDAGTTLSIPYGTQFHLKYPETTGNYAVAGWSKNLYKLGETPETQDVYYINGSYTTSASIVLDSTLLGEDSELVLYPVYKLVGVQSANIISNNGEFSYKIENDNNLLKGYIDNPLNNVVDTTSSSVYIQEIGYYQTLTIKADRPNANYEFSSMTHNSTLVDGDELVVAINESTDNTHIVTIEYSPKTIEVTLQLSYEKEQVSGTDLSEITIGTDIVLSKNNPIATTSVLANGSLVISFNIRDNYVLSSIQSGSQTVTLVDNRVYIADLQVSADDKATVTFVLSPKSYAVTINANGGTFNSNITYSSTLFGNGEIEVANTINVIQGAMITIPSPTKAGYTFSYFTINGTQYTEVEDFAVTTNLNIIANYTKNTFTLTYKNGNGGIIKRVDFIGGSTITIGQDIQDIDYTPVGVKHLGWKLEGDTSEKIYQNNETITSLKKNYTFCQVTEGEKVTINFLGSDDSVLKTKEVEYGKAFNLPLGSEFDAQENMFLYGFTSSENGGGTVLLAGSLVTIFTDGDIVFAYPEIGDAKVNLYLVYYPQYTYKFVYENVVENIETTYHYVNAVASTGAVNSNDLTYTINSTTPQSSDADKVFAGYTLKINGVVATTGEGESEIPRIVSAGEALNLIEPTMGTYLYTYTLSATFKLRSGTKPMVIQITNPENESEYLNLTYNSSSHDNYTISIFADNKFYSSSLPYFDYATLGDSAEWKIGGQKVFETTNANLVAYKLLGYSCTTIGATGEAYGTPTQILFSQTEGYNIGGENAEYLLKPIWEDRYSVTYYDDNAQEVSKVYYDKDTTLNVDDNSTKYSRTGYVFVGYASTQDKSITSVEDYYDFGQEYEIDDSNYTFYPAFSQLYNVEFVNNQEVLVEAGGVADNIEVTTTALQVYVGMPETDLSLAHMVNYNGVGYEFKGFTLESGKLANDLTDDQVFLQYSLDYQDLADGKLTIYVAWSVAEYDVEFVITAVKKDGTKVDNEPLTLKYRHNTSIVFTDASIVEKRDSIVDDFEFEHYSLLADGSSVLGDDVVVTSDMTVYLIYNYFVTIVYDKGQAVVNEGAEAPASVKKHIGNTFTGYNANANLSLEGRSGLYWTPVIGGTTNFFGETNTHKLTETDVLNYATNDYVITLYIGSRVATYNVELFAFQNESNFKNYLQTDSLNYYSSIGTIQLEYGEGILTIVENDNGQDPTITSPFDDTVEDFFSQNGNSSITQLSHLFDMFESIGYEFTGNIRVNNEYTYISQEYNNWIYYTAKTYSSTQDNPIGAFDNKIYLRYSLKDYTFAVRTLVAEVENGEPQLDGAYSTNDILNVFELDGETETTRANFSVVMATIETEINLIYKEDYARENETNNYSYNFVGYYGAKFDAEGNITELISVEASDTVSDTVTIENREDGLYGGKNRIYHITGDTIIYAVYSERPVIVSVTYKGVDTHIDELKSKISLNGKEVTEFYDVVESSATMTKTFKFKALYAQQLQVVDAEPTETVNYYVIENFFINDIGVENNILNTTLTNSNGDLTTYAFTVQFTTLKTEVYAKTLLDSSPYNVDIYATVSSIEVLNHRGETVTIDGDDIVETYFLNNADNTFYNYILKIPYSSTITSINASLHNYTITGWEMGGSTFETLLVDEVKYIKARLVANDIVVKYYTSQDQELTFLTQSNLKYGDKITLPYVVVDEGKRVSFGWKIADLEYEYGQEISAVHPDNEQLEYDEALGRYILKIDVDYTEKYYLIFANGDGCTFEIPASYTTPSNDNAVTEKAIFINGVGKYQYYNVVDEDLEERTISGGTFVFSNYYYLPEEISFENNLSFGGWTTKTGSTIDNKIYQFGTNDITDSDEHEIKLTTILSGYVAVKFYIVDPSGETLDTLKLSTSTNGEYSLDYVQVFYDKDANEFPNYLDITESKYEDGKTTIRWGSGYFSRINMDLFGSYEFYGWVASTSPIDTLDTPSTEIASITNGALKYAWSTLPNGERVRTSNSLSDKNERMLELLGDSKYTFYSVWEEKKTITFDASNSDYENTFTQTNKYSEGEDISLPNNLLEDHNYHDLKYGTRKWTGWKSGNEDIVYVFDNLNPSESGGYVVPAPDSDTTFTPTWETGAQVIFNMNFDSARSYFGEVMGGGITNYTGYPILVADAYEYTPYDTELKNALVINGSHTEYTFTKSYREGKFWSAGSQIPVYKYADEAFSQVGIFTTYATMDKYFDLVGWYYDANKDGQYTNGELITSLDSEGRLVFNITSEILSSNNGTISLYAYWKPVDLEISFYYSKDSAISGDTGRMYVAENDGNYERITVTVPFGYKLTNKTEYVASESALSLDNILYLYSGIAEGMSNPTNLNVNSNYSQFYRFNHWNYSNEGYEIELFNNEAVTGTLAKTISNRVVRNMALYPVFDRQYLVQYVNVTGEILSSDTNKLIITGEDIAVKDSLEQILDTRILRDVYYYDNINAKVELYTRSSNILNVVDKVTFNEETFRITNEYYVEIYVDINIAIRAFVPDYTNGVVAKRYTESDKGIYQGYTYILRELYSITDSYLKTNYGDEDNYPTFAGWFLYTGSDYYNSSEYTSINGTSITTISIIAEKIGSSTYYYAVVNGNVDDKKQINIDAENGGLIINVYAKLYVLTTVTLGKGNDQAIHKYADMTYDSSDQFNNSKYIITETKQLEGKLNSVTYQSVYNSGFAPVISIVPTYGYKVSSVSNFDEDIMSELITSVTLNNKVYSDEASRFKATIGKTTTEVSDTDLGTKDMQLKYTFKFSNIYMTNGMSFAINIDYITYNVTYNYDNTIAEMYYRTANTTSSAWRGFSKDGDTIRITTDRFIYIDGSMLSIFDVDYTVSISENITSVKFTNVPYGYPLFIGAIAQDKMLYHFERWELASTSAMGGKYVGVASKYVQSYTPVLFNDNGYEYNISVTAIMELNEVKSVEYTLRFSPDSFVNGSAWHELLEQASMQIDGFKQVGSSYEYVWTPAGTENGLPAGTVIRAGESMSDLLETIKGIYNATFNVQVATISNNTISSIGELLNYFWYTGLWGSDNVYADDVCQLINNDILHDVIKVSEDGKVYIYTLLDRAVLVNALHQVRDYQNNDIVILDNSSNRVDRADIQLNGVQYASNDGEIQTDKYFTLNGTSSNRNSIIIKMPFGSRVAIEVTPDGANEDHIAYSSTGWSLINSGAVSERVVIGSQSEYTLDTSGNTSHFVVSGSGIDRVVYPEYQLVADVVADTYDIILFNEDDSTIGDRISIAYDKKIYNIDSSRYVQYGYSLSTLRDVGKLHLFVLDADVVENNRNVTTFCHSLDSKTNAYGGYQYLFSNWALKDGDDLDAQTKIVNYQKSGATYRDVELKAEYYTNATIKYQLLDEDISSTQNVITYYLPEYVFKDQFDNEYRDDLLLDYITLDISRSNGRYSTGDAVAESNRFGQNYYTISSAQQGALYIGTPNPSSSNAIHTNENFVCVKTVRDIISNNSEKVGGAHIVYPSIDVGFEVQNNTTTNEYTARTIGGRMVTRMKDGGQLEFYNIVGLYRGSSTTSLGGSGTIIAYSISLSKQFAYWEISEFNRGVYSIVHNLDSTPYSISTSVKIATHYNSKLSIGLVDAEGFGSVDNVTDVNGDILESSGLSTLGNQYLVYDQNGSEFEHNEPSRAYVAKASLSIADTNIAYRSIVVEKSGFRFYVIDKTDEANPVTLYTGLYNYDPSKNDNTSASDILFVWQITCANTNECIQLVSDGEFAQLDDSWGTIYLVPVVFAKEVQVTIESNLYIYNVNNQEFQEQYGSAISTTHTSTSTTQFTIQGGSLMTTELDDFTNSGVSSWNASSKLSFQPLGGAVQTLIKATAVSSLFKPEELSALGAHTQNYRWQYWYNNQWIDIVSGETRINASVRSGDIKTTKIRLACDWRTVDVQLIVMNELSVSDFASTNYNGLAGIVVNTLQKGGSGFCQSIDGVQNNTLYKTMSIRMLEGDTVACTQSASGESISLHSDGAWANMSDLVISEKVASNEYSQGWFSLEDPKDTGRYSIQNMPTSLTFGKSHKKPTFALWTEKSQIKSVRVDKDQYEDIVNGYGKATITQVDIKKTDTILDGGESPLQGKTGYYAISVKLGVSSRLTFKFESNEYKHKFKQIKYTNSQGVTVEGTRNECSIIAGETGSTFKVLYDASDTRTQYFITDKLGYSRFYTDIYGGYTVNYDTNTSTKTTTVTIQDMFGTQTNKLTIYLQNENGVSTSDKIYPRQNYRASDLYVSRENGGFAYDTENGIIKVLVEDMTAQDSSKIKATDSYTHEGTDASNCNAICVWLNEYLYAVNLKIQLVVDNGKGKDSTVYSYLNPSVASITVGDSKASLSPASGNKTTLRIENLNTETRFDLYYNVNQDISAMVLARYESDSTTQSVNDYIRSVGNYTLLGVDILDRNNQVCRRGDYFSSEDSSLIGAHTEAIYFEYDTYILRVRLSAYLESNVSFALTLPYDSDLRALQMTSNLHEQDSTFPTSDTQTYEQYYALGGDHSELRGMKPIVFNNSATTLDYYKSGWESGQYINRSSLVLDTGVYATIKNGRLEIYDSADDLVGYINYTLPNTFAYKGNAEGLGWYVDKSTTPSLLIGENKPYKQWHVDTTKLTPITSGKVELGANSTIVLALERKEISIYIDKSGSWWQDTINNDTISGYSGTVSDIDPIKNIDTSTYLSYGYMSSNGFETKATKMTAYGGLATVIPMDSTTMYMPNEKYWKSAYPAEISKTIRTGFYINTADSPLTSRIDSKVYTTHTQYICSSFKDEARGVLPAMLIVGENKYNVELNTSTKWYIAGVPSGDSEIGDSTYTKVTLHLTQHSASPDTNASTVCGEFNFVSGKIKLLQSVAGWSNTDYTTRNDNRQRQFTFYIAKDNATRLYNGMFISGNSSYSPVAKKYAGVKYTFTGSGTPKANNERIVLSGYFVTYRDGSGVERSETIAYEDFIKNGVVSGDIEYDLKGKSNVHIYPVWEIKKIYSLTIKDDYAELTGNNARSKTTYYLEGSTVKLGTNLNKTLSLTTAVTTTTAKTESVAVKTHTSGSTQYVFMGLSESAQLYGTGSIDGNFSDYGYLRIYRESDKSYKLQKNDKKISNRSYSVSVDMDQNYTLYAIWQQLGYSVIYQFNGKTSNAYTRNTLKNKYSNASDSSIKQTIQYSTYLQDMPFKVETDYTSFSSTGKYGTDGWRIKNYFGASNSTTSIDGTLKPYTSTIYFSLVHNCGHASNPKTQASSYTPREYTAHSCENAGSSSHYQEPRIEYNCKYCDNQKDVSDGAKTSCSSKTEWEEINDKKHYKIVTCRCSKCTHKEISNDEENHTTETTIDSEPTCTKPGGKSTKCKYCKRLVGLDIIPKLGHLYSSTISNSYKTGWQKMNTNSNINSKDPADYNCATGKYAWYQHCNRDNCDGLTDMSMNGAFQSAPYYWASGNMIYKYHYPTITTGKFGQISFTGGGESNPWSKHEYGTTKTDNDNDDVTCANGYYYHECTRIGCTARETIKEECKYTFTVFQLTKDRVENPDIYNCYADIWTIKFPCFNCGNTYNRYADTNCDLSIRLRINQLEVKGNEVSSRDVNSISNGKPHHDVKWVSTGLFSGYYECGGCNKVVEKAHVGSKTYVLANTFAYPDWSSDYVLEFQPSLGYQRYLYKYGNEQLGLGSYYRREYYKWPSEDYGSDYWLYWTNALGYKGWWAIVEMGIGDGKRDRGKYYNSLSEWEYDSTIQTYRWAYKYVVYEQKIYNGEVRLYRNCDNGMPIGSYDFEDRKFLSDNNPYRLPSDTYEMLLSKLSDYIFNGKDNRDSRVKKRSPHESLRIDSSSTKYIYIGKNKT